MRSQTQQAIGFKKCLQLVFLVGLAVMTTVVSARAELDGFLSGLNNRYAADPNDYGVRLSMQFGVPQPQVTSLIRSVGSPADAFMCLQLARMLGLPHDRVLHTYNADRGRGWGVIAKDLGIKPGSPEFHALKRGDYALTGTPAHHGGHKKVEQGKGYDTVAHPGYDDDHGKGKGGGGKGKGNNK